MSGNLATQIATIYIKPGQTASVVNDAVQAVNTPSEQNTCNVALGGAQLVDALATGMGKSLPYGLGTTIAGTSLVNNTNQIASQLEKGKQVDVNLVQQAAADIAAISAGLVTGLAVAVAAPELAVLGAALILTSGALTVAAVANNGKSVSPEMQMALESLYQSTQNLLNNAGAMADSILKNLSDIGPVLQNSEAFIPCDCNNQVAPATATNYKTAKQAIPPRRDPLTLDLNGDGIQTVPLKTPPLLFDITASGVKVSTGWIVPSDGLLVMDRNGNGLIDSGAELFGDATPAYAAGTSSPTTGSGRTVDGFAALAQEDTNGDGLVNNLDTNFASLRVWQDANQDGISQANELKTLTDAGIASFNVSRSTHSQTLANGNQIADVGTFTRTDGTTGTAGSVNGMADVNLAVDTFTSSFTDTIPLTVQAQTLPDMQGSGMVREMRQAASLQTTTGQTFAAALAQYNAATTREEQLAQIDQLISAWGATAEMGTLQTGRCKRLAANDVELGKRRLG